MFLVNLRIGIKIGAIVVALSLAGLSYVWMLNNRIEEVDTAYSDLISTSAMGATLLARSNARAQEIGYASYRAMVYDGASTQAKASADEVGASIEKASANWDKATELLPAYAQEIRKLREPFVGAMTKVKAALGASMKDDDQTARGLLAEVDPILTKIASETLSLVERIDHDISQASDDMTAANLRQKQLTYGIALLTGILGLILSYFVVRTSITGPLFQLSNGMSMLAAGDLSVTVDGLSRKDEIGQMAAAVQVFKDNGLRAAALKTEVEVARNMTDAERARAEEHRAAEAARQALVVTRLGSGLQQLANGDLTVRMSQFPQDYAKLEADFNEAVERLQTTLIEIAGDSGSIDFGTTEIAEAADNLSKRTEQQAASLEETAAALEQITATVKKTSEGATHARQVVEAAKDEAESSGRIVSDAVMAMNGIEKSSAEITQIIGVIDEIAFQTNLLALNAGVEAARAGEAGRGFAVVASEVRALAQRSAEAAKEIKALISTSTSQVAAGVSLVGETGRALNRILAQVADIAHVVREIAASAQEQAAGLDEVNTAVNQMDQITQQNAAMVEESTAATHSVSQDSKGLTTKIARFNLGQAATQRQAAPRRAMAAAKAPAAARAASRMSGRPLSHGATALKAAPDQDSWTEF